MLNKKWLLPVILLVVPVVVYADDHEAVTQWLQKMHRAAHTINYVGKFVYQQDKQLTLMEIIHAVDDEGERERLISLDEVGREVIREKNKVTCILPDRQSVVVEKGRPNLQFPPAFPMNIEHLRGQYRFILDRRERVAGQTAQKISINPVDKFRYGHRLWVDVDSGLLLKTHLLDEKGRLLEQFMFTEIEFMNEIPEEMLKPRVTGKNYTWYEADGEAHDEDHERLSDHHDWLVSRMPAGFIHDMQRDHNLANKTAVKHMVFSDGLASVSVFIEKRKKQSPNLIGASRMGAVNAYGKIMSDYHVTAVGEVPQATVRMISDSVQFKTK